MSFHRITKNFKVAFVFRHWAYPHIGISGDFAKQIYAPSGISIYLSLLYLEIIFYIG